MDKEAFLSAMRRFVSQRSGMDPRNYSDRRSFMVEYREMLRDGRDARIMLRAIERSGISADAIRGSFSAFGGRLSPSQSGQALDYCAGQYWGLEYRRAAAAVCAHALYLHWGRGHQARQEAKRSFGKRFADRWFQ